MLYVEQPDLIIHQYYPPLTEVILVQSQKHVLTQARLFRLSVIDAHATTAHGIEDDLIDNRIPMGLSAPHPQTSGQKGISPMWIVGREYEHCSTQEPVSGVGHQEVGWFGRCRRAFATCIHPLATPSPSICEV